MPLGFDELADGAQEAIKCTFGETQTVEYRPITGAPYDIVAVYNDRHQQIDPDTERLVSSNQPTLGVKLSDLTAVPVKGDKVFITKRAKEYIVHDSQEDGEGWSELFLYEVG